jgi:hypothetical protein
VRRTIEGFEPDSARQEGEKAAARVAAIEALRVLAHEAAQ